MFQHNTTFCMGIKVYEARKRWITTSEELYYIPKSEEKEEEEEEGMSNGNEIEDGYIKNLNEADNILDYFSPAEEKFEAASLNYPNGKWDGSYSNYQTMNAMTRTYLLGESLNLDDFLVVKLSSEPIVDLYLGDQFEGPSESDIMNFTVSPEYFTESGKQMVTFSYLENNVKYTYQIEVNVLPYKRFSEANWDEVYEACCARQNGKMEEKYYGDVWQRFVKYGDKKILQLPGEIDNSKHNVNTATKIDGTEGNSIGESNTRVFPLYKRGFCEVAVIGIETDGIETGTWATNENGYNPISKGTITLQVCDLENTIESFAQSTRLAGVINAWSSNNRWVSQLLLFKYCYLFYNLLDEKMKSYIHAPGVGVELNTYKKKGENDYERDKRYDLKTGYYANIDAVENAMRAYECLGTPSAWLRSGKREIYQLFGKQTGGDADIEDDGSTYKSRVQITNLEEWNNYHDYTLSKKLPVGYTYSQSGGYQLDLIEDTDEENELSHKWSIIQNQDEDGNPIISNMSKNVQFLDSGIRATYSGETYKKIIKLPDNFPSLTYDSKNKSWYESDLNGGKSSKKDSYIKASMLTLSQVFTKYSLDILSIYNFVVTGYNNIKSATMNDTTAKYRFHKSQMANASVSVYPFQLAVKQKLLELDDDAYKSNYWPITPVFIPSLAEFGIKRWITTQGGDGDDKNKIVETSEDAVVFDDFKLGKFVKHYSFDEKKDYSKTYIPKFKYDPKIYTWKQGDDAPEHWLWTRDVIESPDGDNLVDGLPFVQVKLNLGAYSITEGPQETDETGPLAADKRILSQLSDTLTSGTTDITSKGKNTEAYIAPAFTIRPARNMHPHDNYEAYEAIQF